MNGGGDIKIRRVGNIYLLKKLQEICQFPKSERFHMDESRLF